MSELNAYLALASYPAIVIFVFNWWDEGSRWARKNKFSNMPPELLSKAEHSGRFLFFFKYMILLLALRLIVGPNFWGIVPIKLASHQIMTVFGVGIIAGLVAFGCRRLLVVISPTLSGIEPKDHLLQGPLALWLMIFAFGAFTEEVWRAFSILALQQNSYGVSWALLLPAFAFAIAHLSGLPPRIPGGLENVIPEAGIGLILGALIVWSGSILPASLASMTYYTFNTLWLRGRYTCSSKALHSQQ